MREVNVLEVLRNINITKLNIVEAAIFEIDCCLREQRIFRVYVCEARIKDSCLGGKQCLAISAASTIYCTVCNLCNAGLDLRGELDAGAVEALHYA